MPHQNLSEAFLRKWYERFSRELRIHASIDVNQRGDLGRVKNYPIDHWISDTEEDANYYDIVAIKMPTYAFMPPRRYKVPDFSAE